MVQHKTDMYIFSGQAPLSSSNSKGIRVCPPELWKFNLEDNSWHSV
jgi:hypothetical protein